MYIDLTDSQPSDLSVDVCVVGAGVAGLTLAHQLIDTGLSVLVVEGGLWEPDAAAQDLARADFDAPHYTPDAVSAGRRRQFGGTANAWTHETKSAPRWSAGCSPCRRR